MEFETQWVHLKLGLFEPIVFADKCQNLQWGWRLCLHAFKEETALVVAFCEYCVPRNSVATFTVITHLTSSAHTIILFHIFKWYAQWLHPSREGDSEEVFWFLNKIISSKDLIFLWSFLNFWSETIQMSVSFQTKIYPHPVSRFKFKESRCSSWWRVDHIIPHITWFQLRY